MCGGVGSGGRAISPKKGGKIGSETETRLTIEGGKYGEQEKCRKGGKEKIASIGTVLGMTRQKGSEHVIGRVRH